MDDLFGDAGDISSDEEDKGEKTEKKRDSDMGEDMEEDTGEIPRVLIVIFNGDLQHIFIEIVLLFVFLKQ